MSTRGHLALLLHAHLPFVRHPERPRQLEEHWLFHALTDCYLPLLRLLRDATARESRFRLTISLSPTLLSMLVDGLLRERFLDHLGRLSRLCERAADRQRADPSRRALTRYYGERLDRLRTFYLDDLGADLVSAWSGLEERGTVELVTTAATHGYLPLLRSRPSAIRAQLRVAADCFRDIVGHVPAGLWLPECGFFPGLEEEVAAAGFGHVVLDAHGVQRASPRPRLDVYAPHSARGVAVFGRDPESAREIWCPRTGFPAHPVYREHHWDLGYEGDTDLLADFLPPGVTSAPTGLKYHRVSDAGAPKAPYDPGAAAARAASDARTFVELRRRRLGAVAAGKRHPIAVAPFDAELFGHWWFEGPLFIDALIRCLDETPDLRAVTLQEHLALHGTDEEIRPAPSSWGAQGYNATWLRAETGWVHLSLHQAAAELDDLLRARRPSAAASRETRLLRQAARSLLLAQSSDWTFHLGRGAASRYAESRLREQLARFRLLADALRGGAMREEQLVALERMDNLFPNLSLDHFG